MERVGLLEAAQSNAFAYPHYGYGYGWRPGSPFFDLPYQRNQVDTMQPMTTNEATG